MINITQRRIILVTLIFKTLLFCPLYSWFLTLCKMAWQRQGCARVKMTCHFLRRVQSESAFNTVQSETSSSISRPSMLSNTHTLFAVVRPSLVHHHQSTMTLLRLQHLVLTAALSTLAPSTTTNAQTLPGCHPQWRAGGSNVYSGGEIASVDGFNYECRDEPLNKFCGQTAFNPGLNGDMGSWTLVWTLLGECEGVATKAPTLNPSSSPTFSAWSEGGCPGSFVDDVEFEGGELVENNGLAFKCKEFPWSGWCGQDGYGECLVLLKCSLLTCAKAIVYK